MHERFASMTTKWFECASKQYTGCIEDREKGWDFRYRFEHEADNLLKASTYSGLCYELAKDVEERTFPWTDEGVAELKDWYQAQYENYCESMKAGKPE